MEQVELTLSMAISNSIVHRNYQGSSLVMVEFEDVKGSDGLNQCILLKGATDKTDYDARRLLTWLIWIVKIYSNER